MKLVFIEYFVKMMAVKYMNILLEKKKYHEIKKANDFSFNTSLLETHLLHLKIYLFPKIPLKVI